MRSGGDGLIGVGLGTSFVLVLGSKIGLSGRSVGRNLVGLEGGEIEVESLGQEDVICNVKKPVEVRGGGASAATIMEFWTMEGYFAGFLKGVSIVAVISRLGGD